MHATLTALATRRALLPLGALALLGSVSLASAQSLSDRLQGVAQQRQSAARQDTSQARLLGALLYQRISANFDDTPAKDAFDFIRTVMDVPLVVRYDTDRNATTGIDPQAPVTLQVDGETALAVINQILAQVEEFDPCTWQLRDGYIEIGPKARLAARAAQQLRMYPIRDMLFDVPYFDNAPNFSIGGGGGGGGGGGFGGGGGGMGGGGGGFGGGGGGFGGGGGGGGMGGGGGGGIPFGDAGEAPERVTQEEKARQLVDIIMENVEPEAWLEMGGDWASIRAFEGVLIVRAPDFIHRQLGGYPFAPQRPQARSAPRTVETGAPVVFTDDLGTRRR
jgi:hypothetical protein